MFVVEELELPELLDPLPELPALDPLPDEPPDDDAALDDPLPDEPPPDDDDLLPDDDPPPDDDPLPELLPLPEPPPEPLPEEPDAADCELAGGAARYMTERMSSSIRRSTARANWARSTSACPAEEYRQYRLSPA